MLENRIDPFVGKYNLSVDGKARINLPIDIVDTLKARNGASHHTEIPLYYKVGSGEYKMGNEQAGFSYLELRDIMDAKAIDFQNYRKAQLEKKIHRFCIGTDIADRHGFRGEAIVVGYGDRFYIFMKKDYDKEGFFDYFIENYHEWNTQKPRKFADRLNSLVNLLFRRLSNNPREQSDRHP